MNGVNHSSRIKRYSQNVWTIVRDSVNGWLDHNATRTGAALAFYTVFSLAPILLLSIAIAGAFFGESAARGEIFAQIRDLIGDSGAKAVESIIHNASQSGSGTLSTVFSVVTVMIGATTALVELKAGLDKIWDVPPERRQGFWYLIRTRLLSVGVILALAFLLLVSLVISAGLAGLEKLSPGDHVFTLVFDWLNVLFSFALVAALFGTIYKVLPSVYIAWRDVTVGAIVTAALFTLGKYAIGAYIGNSGLGSTYGAAGSVILVLVWVFYSAQIFLLGAEFTRTYAHQFGSRSGASPVRSQTSQSTADPDPVRARES
jgi:membrane protein